MGNLRKESTNLRPVKVHEPKCPSRILQIRPQCDLRLLLNKKKQMHKTETIISSKGINRTANFQIDRRIKMSRQEVYVTVFENMSRKVKKEIKTSKSINSEVKQINYTFCNVLSSVVEDKSIHTNSKKTKIKELNTLNKFNNYETNKNEYHTTQICKKERQFFSTNLTDLKPLDKDLIYDESASEEDSISSDEYTEELSKKIPRKRHPNRRLTLEKPVKASTVRFEKSNNEYLTQGRNGSPLAGKKTTNEEPGTKVCRNKMSGSIVNVTSTNTSEVDMRMCSPSTVWNQVLYDSDLWKREECWCQGRRIKYEAVETMESEDSDSFLDLLGKTTQALEQSMEFSSPCLQDPAFYIPPAHAYLLWWKLTDDMTAVQSVERVCEIRGWPNPEYQFFKDAAGWTVSLLLHCRTFSSVKPAVTAELAKQVAAQELLQRLNLQPRPLSLPR